MKKFKIYAGLGGGFGGANYIDTIECEDEHEAMEVAFYHACEEYESYAGLYGLRDFDDIIQDWIDDGIDEEDIDEAEVEIEYEEDRESWLDYYVEEVK